jgi:hypothetical protein
VFTWRRSGRPGGRRGPQRLAASAPAPRGRGRGPSRHGCPAPPASAPGPATPPAPVPPACWSPSAAAPPVHSAKRAPTLNAAMASAAGLHAKQDELHPVAFCDNGHRADETNGARHRWQPRPPWSWRGRPTGCRRRLHARQSATASAGGRARGRCGRGRRPDAPQTPHPPSAPRRRRPAGCGWAPLATLPRSARQASTTVHCNSALHRKSATRQPRRLLWLTRRGTLQPLPVHQLHDAAAEALLHSPCVYFPMALCSAIAKHPACLNNPGPLYLAVCCRKSLRRCCGQGRAIRCCATHCLGPAARGWVWRGNRGARRNRAVAPVGLQTLAAVRQTRGRVCRRTQPPASPCAAKTTTNGEPFALEQHKRCDVKACGRPKVGVS